MANDVRYKAAMTRQQWRDTFLRAETTNPPHKAALRWVSSLAAEIHEVAEVTIRAATGAMTIKPFEKERASERVELELSRDAVLGIKLIAIKVISGERERDGSWKFTPANLLERASLLASLKEVGPGGTLLRLVEKEAVLPDSNDLDEEELDLEPEGEKGTKKAAAE